MKQLLLLVLFASSAFAQTNIEETRIHSARWTKDGSPYRVYNTVTIDSLLVIEPGVRVVFVSKRDGSHASIEMDSLGKIYAVGTETDSIIFTSYWDDYGWGRIGTPRGGKYQNVLKYCVFERASNAVWATSVDPAKPDTVTHCSFRNNTTAIRVTTMSIYISDCVFTGNRQAVDYYDFSENNPTLLIIERCELINNGGSIQIAGKAANAVIRNCIITGSYGGVEIALGKNITIGGAPEYCNHIYNNIGWDGVQYNLTRSGKFGFLDARYNYWGSTDRDTISKSIWIQYPDSASWLPFNDENCNPVPLSVTRPMAASAPLLSLYPNPVIAGAPVTLRYTLQTASSLTLKVQDILGRVVREDFLGRLQPGEHTRIFSTATLHPGMYFYSLLPGNGKALSGWMVVR